MDGNGILCHKKIFGMWLRANNLCINIFISIRRRIRDSIHLTTKAPNGRNVTKNNCTKFTEAPAEYSLIHSDRLTSSIFNADIIWFMLFTMNTQRPIELSASFACESKPKCGRNCPKGKMKIPAEKNVWQVFEIVRGGCVIDSQSIDEKTIPPTQIWQSNRDSDRRCAHLHRSGLIPAISQRRRC